MPAETEWARRKRRDAMRKDHDGKCDLCGAAKGVVGACGAKWNRSLDEDHDHITDRHRGFICWRANKWLARWVTVEWLLRAAAYMSQSDLTYVVRDDGWVIPTLTPNEHTPVISDPYGNEIA